MDSFNNHNEVSESLCPKCKNTKTVEHNGGQWCPICAKFAVPPTSRHKAYFRASTQSSLTKPKPILLTCSCCGQKDSMGDGLYDDGEWICGGCLSGIAYGVVRSEYEE